MFHKSNKAAKEKFQSRPTCSFCSPEKEELLFDIKYVFNLLWIEIELYLKLCYSSEQFLKLCL